MTTHYEHLGVDPTASTEEIRLAYLRLARRQHPDTRPGAEEEERRQSNQAMAATNAAWFVLRDAERRRLYDLSILPPHEPASSPAPDPEYATSSEASVDYGYAQSTGGRDVTTGIARLWAFVLTVVVLLLAALFTYAFVKSGSVGAF